MIIALLAVLGVSVWVLVVLVALMLFRRRWLSRQPGAFLCAVREVAGDVSRARGRWRRGYGRRRGSLLVWDPLPTLVSGSSLLELTAVGESRPARSGEIRRMGDHPMIVELALTGGSNVAVALRAEHSTLAGFAS